MRNHFQGKQECDLCRQVVSKAGLTVYPWICRHIDPERRVFFVLLCHTCTQFFDLFWNDLSKKRFCYVLGYFKEVVVVAVVILPLVIGGLGTEMFTPRKLIKKRLIWNLILQRHTPNIRGKGPKLTIFIQEFVFLLSFNKIMITLAFNMTCVFLFPVIHVLINVVSVGRYSSLIVYDL